MRGKRTKEPMRGKRTNEAMRGKRKDQNLSAKALGRFALWAALVIVVPVLGFALAAWIGSAIPRNSHWTQPDPQSERSVTILIGSNAVHTEIVMPIITPQRDWRATFPASDIAASQRPYTHVAVSWGERVFFLETPTWSDLNPVTAASAMVGGKGVLHVAHYVRPAAAEDYRELRLRPAEYRRLADAIAAQLAPPQTRETLPGYGAHDVFYTSSETYHLGNTCNQWTSDRLADAGVRIATWSPLPGGVMRWVPAP